MAAAAGAVALFWAAQGAGQTPPGPAWEVYFQATYANGLVRDLNEVPTNRKNLRRVVRIARYEGYGEGHRLISTGPYPVTEYRSGRTVKNELMWDGKAWIARPVARPHAPMADVLRTEHARLRKVVGAMEKQLARQDHAVAAAKRQLSAATDDAGKAAAAESLAAAGEHRKATAKALELYRIQLKAIGPADRPNVPAEIGKIGFYTHAAGDAKMLGSSRVIREARTLPHRVQVWPLPAGKGERNISVAMSHPEAGQYGAFHYVAYADTDGDGRPDQIIGISPLATANQAGEWTNWDFRTDEPQVFVGNAWTNPSVSQYYDSHRPGPGRQPGWTGLGGDVFVSGYFGGIPNFDYAYDPYLTNLQVHVSNPSGLVEQPPAEIRYR